MLSRSFRCTATMASIGFLWLAIMRSAKSHMRVTLSCRHRWNVERASQAGIAALGNVGVGIDAGPGTFGHRVEAGLLDPGLASQIRRQHDQFGEDRQRASSCGFYRLIVRR
jgi:hypothetical protein